MEFVYEIPNNLSDEMCEKMIEKFENDDRKKPGVVGDERKVRPVKTSLDLCFNGMSEWKEVDEYLYKQLQEGVKQYREYLNGHVGGHLNCYFEKGCHDTGYQIQKSV